MSSINTHPKIIARYVDSHLTSTLELLKTKKPSIKYHERVFEAFFVLGLNEKSGKAEIKYEYPKFKAGKYSLLI